MTVFYSAVFANSGSFPRFASNIFDIDPRASTAGFGKGCCGLVIGA
jgi:hypothetical protein